MAHGICKLLWLKVILSHLKVKKEKTMMLYCDNKATLSHGHSPAQHDRTKHVEIDRHFIKEKLGSKQICVPYVSSKSQLANVLTKVLPTTTFQNLINKLGMQIILASALGRVLESAMLGTVKIKVINQLQLVNNC